MDTSSDSSDVNKSQINYSDTDPVQLKSIWILFGCFMTLLILSLFIFVQSRLKSRSLFSNSVTNYIINSVRGNRKCPSPSAQISHMEMEEPFHQVERSPSCLLKFWFHRSQNMSGSSDDLHPLPIHRFSIDHHSHHPIISDSPPRQVLTLLPPIPIVSSSLHSGLLEYRFSNTDYAMPLSNFLVDNTSNHEMHEDELVAKLVRVCQEKSRQSCLACTKSSNDSRPISHSHEVIPLSPTHLDKLKQNCSKSSICISDSFLDVSSFVASSIDSQSRPTSTCINSPILQELEDL